MSYLNENTVAGKSKAFAVRVVGLYKYLCSKKEFVLSKQVLRSGTSIGANVREAVFAQSKKEFIAKMNTALKEASETLYWLELMFETEYIVQTEYKSLERDCTELIKLLVSIIKKSNSTAK